MPEKALADIPESYLDYRAEFEKPIFESWAHPSGLVEPLFSLLQKWGVTLGDISWNKDATSYKDTQITVNVLKSNAIVRVALDNAGFSAINPDWGDAPALVELFESCFQTVRDSTKASIKAQEIALAMHVKAEQRNFQDVMTGLVNAGALGSAEMYGISVYEPNFSFVIDKSLRYPNAVFVRLHRRHGPSVPFSEITTTLYQDEMRALGLLGLQELRT